MAKSAGGVLLPVSAEAGKGDGEAALFKGSAMTRRGAVAALSYMSCSGTCLDPRLYFSMRLWCGVELAPCLCVFLHGGGRAARFA